MVKITFLGDIMCEPLMLKKARKGKDKYDFDFVFKNIWSLLDKSDYVIGNLETPLAGKNYSFTKSLFSFNTPDEFIISMKKSGIDFVTTSNNHCLDRGIAGLRKTIEALDNNKILHTGTWKNPSDKQEACYFTLNNIKIGIIGYTYGTNYFENKINISKEKLVNLLKPEIEPYYIKKVESRKPIVKRLFLKILNQFNEEHRFHIKKRLGLQYNEAHEDNYLNIDTIQPYITNMQNDIIEAKKKADFVFFLPHVGGQFNHNPGIFTEYVFEKAIEAGCDAIIASHPHVVQKFEYNKIPCFYSLGNFSMSPNSVYLLHDYLPEYGIASHFYISNRGVEKISFSILKIVESKRKGLTVYPIDVYSNNCNELEIIKLKKDILLIYNTVMKRNNNQIDIQVEYDIWNRMDSHVF